MINRTLHTSIEWSELTDSEKAETLSLHISNNYKIESISDDAVSLSYEQPVMPEEYWKAAGFAIINTLSVFDAASDLHAVGYVPEFDPLSIQQFPTQYAAGCIRRYGRKVQSAWAESGETLRRQVMAGIVTDEQAAPQGYRKYDAAFVEKLQRTLDAFLRPPEKEADSATKAEIVAELNYAISTIKHEYHTGPEFVLYVTLGKSDENPRYWESYGLRGNGTDEKNVILYVAHELEGMTPDDMPWTVGTRPLNKAPNPDGPAAKYTPADKS